MSPINPTNPTEGHNPVLKVVGLGGGGSNAVNRMIELGITGVDFIAANTDRQALKQSLAPVRIQLGPKLTRGLGAGGNPEIGYKSAEESRNELAAALHGADMVFLAAGMGGGTGTGSIAVASEVARQQGAVTIAVVTTPFSFEMGRRQKNATDWIAKLRPHCDTLIAIPNDRLLYAAPKDLPLDTAFRMADDVLRQAVQGIAELATEPGLINVDFAHIRNMMKLGGGALMAIGQGKGPDKTLKSVHQALNHPLLESIALHDAAGIIANFSGGKDLSLFEVGEAITKLQEMAGDQVDVIMGVTNDERMYDRAQVILVITGLGGTSLEEVLPGAEKLRPKPQVNQNAAFTVKAAPQPAYALADMQDPDIPAFMRKRVREQQLSHDFPFTLQEQDQ
ncbi:MAG: cell division protein FtsZ [Chloroflexi bacterium]|nr:MAG: cell division protein FtsZ [Chloroflexota bacterium]MBL1193485.1 cell division protein FtsZ [Chloroflexota bacterium]NOH10776.1 cell division protein FtsZ [Chloroflexota bacterium]